MIDRDFIAARDNVPAALIPLLDFVYKWGDTGSDEARYALADKAESDPQLWKELEDFNNAFTPELQKIYDEWAWDASQSDNETSLRFYFTFLLLDELDFKPPRDPAYDPLQDCIELITRAGKRSLYALSSLPDYGEEAKRAVSILEDAVDDPSPSVRVWAHYALARLIGEKEAHTAAIVHIRDENQGDEFVEQNVESALWQVERTEEQHHVAALGGFCITNEVKQIQRLLAVVNVDALDDNGGRALGYAVGNGHPEAVRALIEHGADPKLKDQNGSTYLHTAAARRDNAQIITLLIEHGADVNATDPEGRTPLDVALECRRQSNADLLRKLGARTGDAGA